MIFRSSAEEAISKMHGTKIDGYRIEVEWAKRPRREIPSYARGSDSRGELP